MKISPAKDAVSRPRFFQAKSMPKLSDIFCNLDMYTLNHYNIENLIKDENKIFKEFALYCSLEEYTTGRIKFLKDTINSSYGENNKKNLELIKYVENRIKITL